jgi:hypothetical protein
VLTNAALGSFNEKAFCWGVQVAVDRDDAEKFRFLHSYWPSLGASLQAAPRCASIARVDGIQLHPDSEEQLRDVINGQVAAAIVLKDCLPPDLSLEILKLAGFLLCPLTIPMLF